MFRDLLGRQSREGMPDTEPILWYAMRATYGRNQEAKKKLDEAGVESFIPMHHVVTIDRRGRKVKKLVPVVRDLVFVRTDRSSMLLLKEQLDYLRNIYIPTEDGKKQIVVVPDNQMENFIKVTSTAADGILFFSPDEINLTKGTRVRIHGGQFNGLEGTFIKVKGARDKRVVVDIAGVIVVATCTLKCDLVEVIKDPETTE